MVKSQKEAVMVIPTKKYWMITRLLLIYRLYQYKAIALLEQTLTALKPKQHL